MNWTIIWMIMSFVTLAYAIWSNVDWYKIGKKLNKDWYEMAMKNNEEWLSMLFYIVSGGQRDDKSIYKRVLQKIKRNPCRPTH